MIGGVMYDDIRVSILVGSGGGDSFFGVGGVGGGFLNIFIFYEVNVEGMYIFRKIVVYYFKLIYRVDNKVMYVIY